MDKREKLTKNEDGKIKYILSLDIKSFFYTINHKILLKTIKEKAFSLDKEKNKYDSDTTTTIEFFLNYLTSNNSGLVVSAQNLISSYLSHVYLSLFDHFVVDNYVQKHDMSYIRYVDDFYLIWSVPDTTKDEENRKFLYKIENELVEFLIGKLELEINPTKSRRNKIYTERDFKKFTDEEKNPSPTDEYYDDYEEEETTNLSLPDEDEETILSKVIDTLTKINENESIEFSDETIDIIRASSLSEIQDKIQTNLPTKPKISIENEVGDFTTKKSIILSVEEREISIEYILREIDNLINPVLVEISQNKELADKLKMDTQFLINVSQKLNFEKAISIISNLKLQLNSWERIKIEKKDENVLNKLILGTKNNGCRDYTHRPQAIQQISDAKLFHDLSSVEFLLIKPKPFLHLITINDTIRVAFENYLLENITNIDNQYKFLFLTERFILQLDFLKSQNRYRSKIELGKTIKRFAEKIMEVINKHPENSNSKVKYLRLIRKMLDKDFNIKPESQNLYTNDFLNDKVSLMQQIKQRVFYEKFGHYNVAFNNLLNEFHELFKIVYDHLNKSKLEATEIGEHMTKEGFATDDVLFVLDFFNRRNKNSISHPNDADLGFWGVSEEEYIKYKERLKPILIKLTKRITE